MTPPDAFGPFRVLHQIGAGALGPVFRAYQPEADRLVAVKLFSLDLPPERGHQLVAAFEQIIAANLTHPSIAAPIATGLSGTRVYLAQDFVSADSLDTIVREYGAAPAREAVRVAAQLAGALDFAAVVNVTHGGLHPRDIILSAGDTRLTGIGVAQALRTVGVDAPVRRPYTAPERAAGEPGDRRADIFSLAALMYELLWARRLNGVGEAAVSGIGPIEGTDSEALRRVFARALAQSPADRYATALAFAEALHEACDRAASAEPQLPLAGPMAPAPPERPAAPQVVALSPVPEPPAPVDPAPAVIPDVELAAAEERRYAEVETAPALVDMPLAPPPAVVPASPPPVPSTRVRQEAHTDDVPTPKRREEMPLRVTPPSAVPLGDRRRSGVLPLFLALLVGLALGFGLRDIIGDSPLLVSSPPQAAETSANAQPAVSNSTQDAAGAANGAAAAPTANGAAAVAPPVNVDDPPIAVRSDPSPAATARGAEPGRQRAPSPPRSAPARETASRETASRAAAAAALDGSLLIRSTPAGARVTIDGRDIGQTPLAIRELEPGAHRVRVSREGFVAQERRVVLSPAAPAQSLEVELLSETDRAAAPADSVRATAGRFTAPLLVESRPSGASVFLNGKRVGTTPMTVPDVPAGAHAIRLELAGYQRWTASVRVVAGERNRVAASLEQ